MCSLCVHWGCSLLFDTPIFRNIHIKVYQWIWTKQQTNNCLFEFSPLKIKVHNIFMILIVYTFLMFYVDILLAYREYKDKKIHRYTFNDVFLLGPLRWCPVHSRGTWMRLNHSITRSTWSEPVSTRWIYQAVPRNHRDLWCLFSPKQPHFNWVLISLPRSFQSLEQ